MKKSKFRNSFGLTRRLLIILTTGFRDQNFLGAFYIPFLLQLIPLQSRKNLALNLLSISPHYYGTVPADIPRQEYIEAEHQRMMISRKSMIEQKVKPLLNKEMTVLDHGCGPGYLAHATSQFCKSVIAADISHGVIACAKAINNQPNIKYITAKGTHLSQISDSSIDLVYSFAVMQHVTDEVCQSILQEFYRVLKPQGKVICEFVVEPEQNQQEVSKTSHNPLMKKIKERYVLRVVLRSFAKIEQFIANSGLTITSAKANNLGDQQQDGEAKPYFHYYTFVLSKP